MTIGIICEYNPFHNGHLYHLNKIKQIYKDATIILVMSGNFTQRGDLSIINKWDKTKIALHYGIDLIIELPFIYASQSSDIFCKKAINILKELQVNKLIFGSETNDINLLTKLAHIQINNHNYNNLVKHYINQGFNYPTACGKALYNLSNINLNTPNDILGLGYIKEIIKQQANIEAISIKRTNDYNSLELNNKITSATSIRHALKNNQDISDYIPKYVSKYINKVYLDDFFDYIKYKILSDDITKYNGVDEKIANRINKYIMKSKTLEELINNIKCKNYTYNRIKRMLIHILIGLTKEDAMTNSNYIRILGFNNKGRKYLNSIKKDIKVPIITNYSNSKGLLDIELKANTILALKLPISEQISFIEQEYKQKVIINDNQ